jgi:hypothetical protein
MHKVYAEVIATKFREVRSCRDEDGSVVAGGPTLSTTLKSLAIPIGAEWLSITPRNFAGGAGTMRYALAPRLTIIITTDLLATGVNPGLTQAPTALSSFPTQDISDEMQNGDQTDFAIDSIDTIANLNAIYIGAPLPFRGATVDIGTGPNGTSSRVLTVKYYAGANTWTDISATDNTKGGGSATFSQDATVTWTIPDAWQSATLFGTADGIDGMINETSIQETWSKDKLYWTRWEFNGALDSDTDVRQFKALARSTDYAELTEGQPMEFSIDPRDVATLEVLTDSGTANVIANAGVLGSNIIGKLPKRFK